MSKSWINVEGKWREAISVWENINGTWKKDIIPSGNVNGEWKPFMEYNKVNGIVTSGLIGYWSSKSGFTPTLWTDLSGKGHSFVLVGSPTLVDDGVYFDGVDDYGKVSTANQLPITTDYTIEFGIKIRDVTSTCYILYGWDSTATAHHRGVNLSSSELLRVNAPASTTTGYTIPLNTYLHVQIKRITDTTHALYINGVFRNNFTTSSPFVGIRGSLQVGTDGGSSRLPATISFMRIYDRALTDQELTKNFLVGREVGL